MKAQDLLIQAIQDGFFGDIENDFTIGDFGLDKLIYSNVEVFMQSKTIR